MKTKQFIFYKDGTEEERAHPLTEASQIFASLHATVERASKYYEEGIEARLTYADGSGYLVRIVEELKEHDIPVKITVKAKTADEARDMVRNMIDRIQGARVIG